ncbi:MAG: hypothetical protein LBR13_05320 [Dysgonamonadaceae bacterium]|jgi:hypothetical protein|nr:hypothetical protein [Dysgonamonadaceae bacterium]
MKKLIFLLIAIGATVATFAQDVITKKNGDEIKAKVTEIGATEVKYKRFGNENGPTYTIPKSEIFMIKYENGEKDIFETEKTDEPKPAVKAEEKTEATPAVTRRNTATRPTTSAASSRQTATQTTPRTARATASSDEIERRGYAGFDLGAAVLLHDNESCEGHTGGLINLNFGYLFTKHFGIASTLLVGAFEDEYSRVGLFAGPWLTWGKKVSFDFRPTLGFGTADEESTMNVGIGLGATLRFNPGSRVSIPIGFDYYYLDGSIVGLTVGLNFRF